MRAQNIHRLRDAGAVIALIAGLLFLSISSIGRTASDEETWSEGTAAFAEADFEKAANAFETLMERGVATVPLWYNLGTTYARIDREYEALWLLHRVLTYDPAHQGAMQNLERVTKRAGIRTNASGSTFAVLQQKLGFSVQRWLNIETATLFWACVALLAFGAAFQTLGRVKSRTALKRTGVVLGVVGLLTAVVPAYRVFGPDGEASATLLRPTAAWSGPSDAKFSKLVDLDPGEVITVASPLPVSGYAKILLANGQYGYVSLDALGLHRIDYMSPE